MVMYHTVRLTAGKGEYTMIYDLATRENTTQLDNVFVVIDDFNKKGYNLTAVQDRIYFLTKRVD